MKENLTRIQTFKARGQSHWELNYPIQGNLRHTCKYYSDQSPTLGYFYVNWGSQVATTFYLYNFNGVMSHIKTLEKYNMQACFRPKL